MKATKLILAIGIVTSSLILADGCLPKHREEVKVVDLQYGVESSGSGYQKSSKVTHCIAYLSNGGIFRFPAKKEDYFPKSTPAIISYSPLLG